MNSVLFFPLRQSARQNVRLHGLTLHRIILGCSAVLLLCRPLAGAELKQLPDAAQLASQPNLPDPLVMFDDGTKVATPRQWVARRRPELKRLFQHYMYGYLPNATQPIRAKVERSDRNCFGGKATAKQVTIQFGPAGAPPIHLLLVVPNQRTKPAPAFVGINFCGNHTVLDDPTIPLPETWIYKSCPGCETEKATDAGRGKQIDVWSIEQSIDRGYAVATFYSGDIKPDRPNDAEGIHRWYWKAGQTKPDLRDWGTIAAWAFGIHRAVDYLLTDKDIDAARIAVVGHSRLGKTALLAGAFDERIALVIAHQAGMGGSAPSRGKTGESVKRINTSFPHWFNGEYKTFNDQPDRLPIDQNCLVALCAPRPVLFTNAVEDQWANPDGQFEVLRAAEPAYKLLKAGALDSKERPPVSTLVASKLGYFIRPGKHSMTREDWKVFLDFADKHLSTK